MSRRPFIPFIFIVWVKVALVWGRLDKHFAGQPIGFSTTCDQKPFEKMCVLKEMTNATFADVMGKTSGDVARKNIFEMIITFESPLPMLPDGVEICVKNFIPTLGKQYDAAMGPSERSAIKALQILLHTATKLTCLPQTCENADYKVVEIGTGELLGNWTAAGYLRKMLRQQDAKQRGSRTVKVIKCKTTDIGMDGEAEGAAKVEAFMAWILVIVVVLTLGQAVLTAFLLYWFRSTIDRQSTNSCCSL